MKELEEFLEAYKSRTLNRYKEYNLPSRPLNEDEVRIIIDALSEKNLDKEEINIFGNERLDKILVNLLREEVRQGSFPETYVKAKELGKIIRGQLQTDYLNPKEALKILGDMKGGPASSELIDLLIEGFFIDDIKEILKSTVLIRKNEFQRLAHFAEKSNTAAEIIESWAKAEFAADWRLKDSYNGRVIKIGDNITTDDLSPSKRANTRTDQPLHALYIMEGREDESDFINRFNQLKKEKARNEEIIMVAGKSLGEGSSRKSAAYTLSQFLGHEIDGEPETKSGGIVVAESIAPIFENSLVASGILPLKCNTSEIKEGDQVFIDIKAKKIIINQRKKLDIIFPGKHKLDKINARGMINFDAGSELQWWALSWCKKQGKAITPDKFLFEFTPSSSIMSTRISKSAQTLAQKLVSMNRLDDKDFITPGETAPIKVRGVFSQDTTGPMTIEEFRKMAGEVFGTEFVVQSLCHTGECPTSEERNRHRFLNEYMTERGGLCLNPGEGIIHTIGNRFVLPTDIIVGGDSHTRTPHGLSFPASSDIVASALKYGKIDLTLDESVKVIFKGEPQRGITARDIVSTLVLYAEKSVGKDIYNGRIIEMEGLSFLNNDSRYILTNAVAERSASAGVIPGDEVTLNGIRDNLNYLKKRADANSLLSVKNNIEAMEEYLKNPVLPAGDPKAEYTAEIEVPLEEITEPLIARPHHPDNIAFLSEVAETKIDEVFIGSCVGGNIDGIRAAARILMDKKIHENVHFVVSPAALDIYTELAKDGSLAALTSAGAVIIMPGCGLCMGNKRRLGFGSIAFTTTTRNYKSRIGPPDSKTYLGSAHVAAITGLLGKIPTTKEYFNYISR